MSRRAVEEELKHTFRPEFLNRVDETVIFRQLTEEDLREIARRMLADTGARMKALGLTLQAEDGAVALLAREGLDRSYGARPLRRLIRSKVEDPAAEGLLSAGSTPVTSSLLRWRAGAVTLEKGPGSERGDGVTGAAPLIGAEQRIGPGKKFFPGQVLHFWT